MANAPTARCTDHDERAQGRRGVTGPDPRTAQSRSARSGGGSSRRILPGIGSRPAAADVNDGPVTMYAVGSEGMQDSRIWADSVLNQRLEPQRAGFRAERTDTRAAMTDEPSAVCDQQTAEGSGRRSRGVQRLGRATDRRPLPAKKLADNYAQFAQTCQHSASGIVDACGPKSPDSHRVVWGLNARPPVPPGGLSSGLPVARRVLPFLRLPLSTPSSSCGRVRSGRSSDRRMPRHSSLQAVSCTAAANCMAAGSPVIAWNGARWQIDRYRRLSAISTCWRASKSSTHLPAPSTTDSSGLSAR